MTTMTEVRIASNIAGGRCQLALIREMLHHGTHLEIRIADGSWQRVTRIVAEVQNEPAPTDGSRYLMAEDNTPAYRVKPDESLWVRVPPNARKAGETP